MKPSRIAILIAVILLVVGGTTAFAASSSAVQSQPNTNCAFRDADGDGICDVCGAAQTAATCSRCGNHYTDADGDGICDNCPAAQTTTSTRGQGNAWHGHQTGHHWGGHHGC